jgi:exopolysaccharide/PEP-CTERM locus tyrosine autokinase
MCEKEDPKADTDIDAPTAPESQPEAESVQEVEATEATPSVEPDAELPRVRPDEQPAELLETRVLDPALIAAELKRVIHIDRARLQADGHLPPPKIERLVANQFRQLKRPLIQNAFGKGAEPVPNGHLVMVTSSLPDEGKTFSSINVAFSLAREKDIEVLLVDADVAKQHLSRIFGIHETPGLLNALADDSIDVESLILATDIKGLSLLPSGQCAEDDIATELLASSRMDAVTARLGGQKSQRIVLFDSPPVLLTNESRVLASLMGQVLLVVRAGVTPRSAVLEAIGYLDKKKPLGLVLNQAKSHAPGGYYGYGAFGYGGYGDNDGEAGQAASKPGRKQN